MDQGLWFTLGVAGAVKVNEYAISISNHRDVPRVPTVASSIAKTDRPHQQVDMHDSIHVMALT